MPETIDDNTLTNLLPKYYKRLFPAYNFCKWLGYSEIQKEYFHKREFSFTLKDDIYLRYQTFNDLSEFEKELLRRCPFKIDIGGVYNQIARNLILLR
jgi:DNA primase small subunit